MVICLIGLSIIVALLLVILFAIIADKRATHYYNKKWEVYHTEKSSNSDFTDTSKLDYYQRKYKIWEKLDRINGCDNSTRHILALFSIIIILVLTLFFAGFKVEGKNDYKEYLLIEQTIEYFVENDIDLDSTLLQRTLEINEKIAKHKQYKQNIWFNWFVYNDICEVESIDLELFKL